MRLRIGARDAPRPGAELRRRDLGVAHDVEGRRGLVGRLGVRRGGLRSAPSGRSPPAAWPRRRPRASPDASAASGAPASTTPLAISPNGTRRAPNVSGTLYGASCEVARIRMSAAILISQIPAIVTGERPRQPLDAAAAQDHDEHRAGRRGDRSGARGARRCAASHQAARQRPSIDSRCSSASASTMRGRRRGRAAEPPRAPARWRRSPAPSPAPRVDRPARRAACSSTPPLRAGTSTSSTAGW
jgi:hypothetical protein